MNGAFSPLSRRAFLVSTAGAALLAAVPACSQGTRRRELERRTLVRVARLLYPHDALDDSVYAEALRPLLSRADRDAELAADLRSGLAMLDASAGGSWRAASPAVQLDALERLEDRRFFQTLQTAVRTRLYQHPVVWTLLGYEGPSLEFGGYLHRGFDDIAWLPVEPSP